MASLNPSPPESQTKASPSRWWQWFLLYPTFGLALLSAAPQWVDKVLAIVNDTKQDSYQEALRENRLWHVNIKCAGAPYAWYTNPKAVKVDATICESGDMFVRASAPGGKEVIKWVALDDVIGRAPDTSSLIPAAHAQSAPPLTTSHAPGYFTRAQYQNVFVVCQRFVDQRMLLRHVNAGSSGCFDEIIDTFNGAVVRRTPVPCRPSC
ncbi:MAG: hypothetical protein ABW194_04960 [Novosphingobium sp.]